jgi:hypothetical protein
MKAAACFLILLALSIRSHAGDAGAPPLAPSDDAQSPPANDAKSQLDYILDNPLQESDYGRRDRCLFPERYRSIEILDSRHLLFIGNRDAVWLNQLRFNCVGLKRDSLLVFEVRDRSLCELDSFHSTPRNAGFSGEFGVHCTLGHFEPISETQADVLRNTLSRGEQSRSVESRIEQPRHVPKSMAPDQPMDPVTNDE